MVNPNKRVKRPNGLGELFKYHIDDEDNVYTLPIKKTLKDNYVYLYRAVNRENYLITDDETCFFFKEIVYDNEVVGFATYRTSSLDQKSIILQHIYVLPDFRGKHLLIEELDEATLLFESNIIIQSPNKLIVKSLIRHKLARVFNDRFVISKIAFIVPMIPLDDALSGIYLEDYDLSNNKGLSKVSLLYDLNLCAVVGLAEDGTNNTYDDNASKDDEDINNYNTISLAIKSDDELFDCVNNRNNDSDIKEGNYFDVVRDVVESNDEVIQNWLTLL